jgi:ABC-2 type transport system permease protein
MHKIWVITRKEWSEVFRNRLVLFSVAFLPMILTALPLAILIGIGGEAAGDVIATSDMPESFLALCGGLSGGDCGAYFLVSEFMLLFMLLPLAIPVTIASYSIVGEKITRTLEPLLATPVSTLQLLAGKSAAAVIPGVLMTWAAFGVFSVGVRLLATPQVAARLGNPMWLLAVFVVGPLLALAAVSIAVMVSSRTSDPRVAEQVSMLVMLPLFLVLVGQATGLILLNEQLVLYIAAGLTVVDVGLMAFAINLFQRETILTRWR